MGNLDRELRSFDARVVRLYRQITHADLTNASNGGAQSIQIGSLRTSVGFVLACVLRVNVYFTGGSASAVTVAVGTGSGGDPDAMVDELNVFDTTPTSLWLPGAEGVSPRGRYGGSTLFATFAPDGGHSLAGLTAGELEVEIIASLAPDVRPGF